MADGERCATPDPPVARLPTIPEAPRILTYRKRSRPAVVHRAGYCIGLWTCYVSPRLGRLRSPPRMKISRRGKAVKIRRGRAAVMDVCGQGQRELPGHCRSFRWEGCPSLKRLPLWRFAFRPEPEDLPGHDGRRVAGRGFGTRPREPGWPTWAWRIAAPHCLRQRAAGSNCRSTLGRSSRSRGFLFLGLPIQAGSKCRAVRHGR